MVSGSGVVSRWSDDEGWGVIESAETPGGCWVHFSVIGGSGGLRSLSVGQAVEFDWEPAEQDGFRCRATAVGGSPGERSAYGSALRIEYDGRDTARMGALSGAVVLRVEEDSCEAWADGQVVGLRFAPQFPRPRTERVSPGHLVAVAAAPDGAGVVVWRWYDAVVLGPADGGDVRMWEPAHGEIVARARPSYGPGEPGSRAYLSAGLPGADWWVTGDPEWDAVEAMYTDNGLWPAVFAG